MKKYFRLPKPFAEKWLAALRSGSYSQYKNTLIYHSVDDEGFIVDYSDSIGCCLGVAALVAGILPQHLAGVDLPGDINWSSVNSVNGERPSFPYELTGYGEVSKYGLVDILTGLNDGLSKTSFNTIIVEYPDIIFHKKTFKESITEDKKSETLSYSFEDIAKFIEDNTEFYEVET